jgi:hypothetical protein
MRRVAPKPHWYDRSVLVVLALAVGIAALLFLHGSAKADPPFPIPEPTIEVSDPDCLANADIERTFDVDDPPPAATYQNWVSFTPADWGVATADDVPIGAIVGQHERDVTLSLINSPCTSALDVSFTLMNCTVDKSETVDFDGQFANMLTVADGCTKWPQFLDNLFPGLTPRARMAGFTFLSGVDLSLNVLIFEPGTSLPTPGLPPSFPPERGYISVSVLNDPSAPLVPDLMTGLCLVSATTDYGLTHDNPSTAEDESGYPWRANPECAGTYTFYDYVSSIPDADGDGLDNDLDTCPHIAGDGDDDGDGLDNACDPTPDDPDIDPDSDGFPNPHDNCPLVWNDDQQDSDHDSIGDACDQDDWNNDGDTDDPGEPTGFDPDTPDGDIAEVWLEADVEISGPSCCPEETATPTPTVSAEATPTPTATETVEPEATPTPTETVEVEICAPVFPGTYSGLVRIDAQPAASGYEVTASIGGVEWGSAIVSGGRYAMDIPDHMPSEEPCFEAGTITFTLNGMACTASPDADWTSGLHTVDLSCAPAAPPVTPEVTPEPTPVAPPPGGAGGLSGSSSGLPLWALALASWAGLTIVAGLGTLVAVKRR